MNRRLLMAGGIGAAALAAGAIVGGRRRGPPAATTADIPWSLEFDTPDGKRFAMASLLGRPLVLNFWATWCPPCVKEMPQLDRFAADHAARGWQVVGLAIDRREPVQKFLEKLPVRFPIVLGGVEGTDLGRQLGNSAGALPYTVVFRSDGRPWRRKNGETSYDELSAWAAEAV